MLPRAEAAPALPGRIDGLDGARTWCGHGVFNHNLVKIAALTDPRQPVRPMVRLGVAWPIRFCMTLACSPVLTMNEATACRVAPQPLGST